MYNVNTANPTIISPPQEIKRITKFSYAYHIKNNETKKERKLTKRTTLILEKLGKSRGQPGWRVEKGAGGV